MIVGYLGWARRTFRQVWLDGRKLQAVPRTLTFTSPADDVSIRMADGSHVHQQRLAGPDAPAGVSPFAVSFDVLVREQDWLILEEARVAGQPIRFFPEWWHVDVWLIANGGPGRTLWRTSRRTPWDPVSEVDKTTHPPEAAVDGTALTVVSTSPPAAGEIFVPDTNNVGQGNNAEVETQDLAGSARLRLVYPPEYLVRIESLQQQAARPNELRASVTLQELIAAEWSDA